MYKIIVTAQLIRITKITDDDGVGDDGVDGEDGVDGHRPPLFDVVENAHNEYGGRHKEKKENHQDLVSII